MSSLFKPTITTYCLPDGKHRTLDGKRVMKDTPGAVRDSHVSEIWYGKFADADGARQRVPLCANKEASKQMLAKLVTDAALGKVGAVDRFAVHNKKPIAQHLADFENHLRMSTNKHGRKNTEHHVKTTVQRARSVIEGCSFKRLREINKATVENCLHSLEGKKGGKPQKQGAQSRNFYLKCVSQFCNGLVDENRLMRNPLTKIKQENVKDDQKHPRRAFTSAEVPWIFATTARSKRTLQKLTGADRVALYAVAFGTGFRVVS